MVVRIHGNIRTSDNKVMVPSGYKRRNWLSHSIHVMFLLDCVLGSLPAPCNLAVHSVNFLHILHWDPAPGSPPGTQYKVFTRLTGSKEREPENNTTTATYLQLNLDNYKYYLTVQAFYNGTWSAMSEEVVFNPVEQTIIGPPTVTLAGYSNSIQVNISLPDADKSSQIPNDDILAFYKAKFRVSWKTSKGIVELKTQEKSVTLGNLETAKEYCVQVHTEIAMNRNTQPSAWVCTHTSIAEPIRVPLLVGTTVGLLVFCIGALVALLFSLSYTGFLWKPKTTVPSALIISLSHSTSLPIEETTPDRISISSETCKKTTTTTNRSVYPATDTTSLEEEEEDEERNVYINRDAENSSGKGSCQNYDIFRTNQLAPSQDSQSSTTSSQAKADTSDSALQTFPGGVDQEETGVDKLESSCRSLWSKTGVKEQIICEFDEEMMENICNISDNVNLFTVTLAALAVSEKDQKTDSVAESLKLSDQELLLSTRTKRILCHTDMETDSDEMKLLQFADGDETCNESSCDDNSTPEEGEEEQLAGYMRR
uniref:cytokine receptor family member b1 n=1 Tax=Doryrhamphus excisus TaxID=161450 RepID=UPI0025ADA996|nr:cytokine receptor family member b1 [Doryrhamphus excisus]XP_057938310.1 cytokine receptor family member b1 [Doryrhamphus excisus]